MKRGVINEQWTFSFLRLLLVLHELHLAIFSDAPKLLNPRLTSAFTLSWQPLISTFNTNSRLTVMSVSSAQLQQLLLQSLCVERLSFLQKMLDGQIETFCAMSLVKSLKLEQELSTFPILSVTICLKNMEV